MNPVNFQTEIQRLINVYGQKAYPRERTELIWQEVQQLSDRWFSWLIGHLIGDNERPPMVTVFREHSSREREKSHEKQKAVQKKEAEEFMKTIYSQEDRATILGQIRLRLNGNMPDQDFKNFLSMVSKSEIFRCNRCQDTKVYHDVENGGMTLCDHRR